VAVTRGLEQLHPAVGLELLLKLDGISDFGHLEHNNFVIEVSVGVDIGQNLMCFLDLALGDQESW
jgi:hypothetical protein